MSRPWLSGLLLLVGAGGCGDSGTGEASQSSTSSGSSESTGSPTTGSPTTGSPTTGGPTTETPTTTETTTAETTTAETTPDTTGGPVVDVVVERVDRFFPLLGDPVDFPIDPAINYDSLTISAAGVADPFDGTFDGASKRTFAGVPEGSYVLRADGKLSALPGAQPLIRLLEVDVPYIDSGLDLAGRPDVIPLLDPSTALDMSVSDMTALGELDNFELYSPETDAIAYLYPDPFSDPDQPAPGATSIDGWSVPWRALAFSGRGISPLIDPDLGDTLVLTHLSVAQAIENPVGDELKDPWSFALFSVLHGSASLTLPTMMDGGSTAATGAFVATPAKQVDLDLGLASFYDELDAGAEGSYLFCSALIYLESGVEGALYSIAPTLGNLSVERIDAPNDPTCFPDDMGECDMSMCPNGCDASTTPVMPADRIVSLAYGNPFAHGTEMLTVDCYRAIVVQHPVDLTNDPLYSGVSIRRKLADADGKLVATIGAPQDLKINGSTVDANDTASVGTTPTITFSPPAFGEPDYYLITVRNVDDIKDGDIVVSRRRTAALIYTRNTSFTLPEDVFLPGRRYYVVVDAIQGAAFPATGRQGLFNQGSASVTSGIVTP